MGEYPALVTGGCGFAGRHVVSRLISEGRSTWIVDDLSTGRPPDAWLPALGLERDPDDPRRWYAPDGATITCLIQDIRQVFRGSDGPGEQLSAFGDVFHLAAVVGGRMKIDGDPLSVPTDLSIDAEFFNWAIQARPKRILYPSSSAAYPTHLQQAEGNVALRQDMIDLEGARVGAPDMTYGWAKLTGEYLARIAAQRYDLHVACVRPFSGYGEDQDESYPVPAIAGRAARREDPLTVWGSGLQGRDFVHIDDCVEAIFRVLVAVSDGSAVNIGSGKLTTFLEVARLFAGLEGYAPEVVTLADKPVGVQARYADPAYSERVLGWRPGIGLEEGFGRVLAAARARNLATAGASA